MLLCQALGNVLKADMGNGEEFESGIFDKYFKLDSDICSEQIDIHGEK